MIVVRTESSVYQLDTENNLLRRVPGGLDASKLRKDLDWIPYALHERFPLTVGEPAVFILSIRDDGVETIRTTTLVKSIDDLSSPPWT